LGAALEYYDFVVYLYVATLIGQAFFPAGMSPTMRLVQTFALYSTGLLIRPVAGILIARVADRVARGQRRRPVRACGGRAFSTNLTSGQASHPRTRRSAG
jgi:MFS family permease